MFVSIDPGTKSLAIAIVKLKQNDGPTLDLIDLQVYDLLPGIKTTDDYAKNKQKILQTLSRLSSI
mgnify:CR=1 FL=1